ncbi:hypothetical protein Xen7305DRAFT_00020880 [Xenococcus sp. PCC 7305]|uniref:hypothetical protein n=1 Tax=Xenococcus sp. PCC 7305 TaxID=102125 RepID=UPI0002AC7AF7|nr:hypothetical protein [Xenococcus sp. PCC 7305]ELS02374.1 hypothetical protein Xen7305DRAFT_00020880 [Xenococcus sp. PCC 7305]
MSSTIPIIVIRIIETVFCSKEETGYGKNPCQNNDHKLYIHNCYHTIKYIPTSTNDNAIYLLKFCKQSLNIDQDFVLEGRGQRCDPAPLQGARERAPRERAGENNLLPQQFKILSQT